MRTLLVAAELRPGDELGFVEQHEHEVEHRGVDEHRLPRPQELQLAPRHCDRLDQKLHYDNL